MATLLQQSTHQLSVEGQFHRKPFFSINVSTSAMSVAVFSLLSYEGHGLQKVTFFKATSADKHLLPKNIFQLLFGSHVYEKWPKWKREKDNYLRHLKPLLLFFKYHELEIRGQYFWNALWLSRPLFLSFFKVFTRFVIVLVTVALLADGHAGYSRLRARKGRADGQRPFIR